MKLKKKNWLSLFVLAALVSSVANAIEPVSIERLRAEVTQHPSDKNILFQLAQELYRSHEYSSYFGLAQWARLKLWPQFTEPEKDRWLALEVLALSRFCHWREIRQLTADLPQAKPRTRRALSFVELKNAYQTFISDPKNKHYTPFQKLQNGQEQWGSSADQFKQIDNPIHLRAEVRSMCFAS